MTRNQNKQNPVEINNGIGIKRKYFLEKENIKYDKVRMDKEIKVFLKITSEPRRKESKNYGASKRLKENE